MCKLLIINSYEKIITFCCCGSIFLTSVNAQERSSGDIELIPHVGYMSAFLNGDEVDGLDPRGSFNFGVIGDYFFNDRWSLRSGINFDSMGASIPGSDLTLNYINIPINANWHFGSTRKWNLNFGVTPGFLTKADLDGDDVKDDYNSFQLGISYGIGYKIEVQTALAY
ncbi:hypothetical protein BWZ20_01100 [Winogradskyella sp. J14-2]|uniref:porin family protein n=1 Tax=Winogradskyella sp. J14-2 TaxID=1936080 RepID=UPI000972B33A|nr:porin family protein [Winogradskyella sp. J14-2]APY06977.1 hypothetical protein BWZ20_01100 [Winogradskyella sp. J14-2]